MSADDPIEMRVMRLPHAADLPLPSYQSAHAAGLDLVAALPADSVVEIAPGARAMIPTGIAIELPRGSEGQIRPRSGLAVRNGITVLNAPGTIDADYRGEIQVVLINHGSESFSIRRGMRIAQLVIGRVANVKLAEVERLNATDRAGEGFGSTGIGSQADDPPR